jgi:hypothetical protein
LTRLAHVLDHLGMLGIRGRNVQIAAAFALIAQGCLEPNPNADAGGTDELGTSGEGTSESGSGESGTSEASSGETSPDTSAETAMPCDPCGLGFELIEFEAGPDDFSGEIPKPEFAHTAPIAFVREYLPGNADELGYAITWTDTGASWQVDVALIDASPNSRVRGVAVVIGSESELTIDELDVAAGECTSVEPPLPAQQLIESVERYDPAGGATLAYDRQAGGGTQYCVTASDAADAGIGVRTLALEIPDGVLLSAAPDTIFDMAGGGELSFTAGDPSWALLHLVGVRDFDDASASDLGYVVACETAAAPFACSFAFDNFSSGARAVLGGHLLGVP